jgi:CubicO group peptidase (beta-lactamase class C family)
VQATPGQQFEYSGGGFTIVQQILIDATGKPFADLLQTTVLNPSGMHESSFQQPIDPSLLARVAMPVDADGKPIPGGPHTYPELAAAGLWTTPSDLARWVIDIQHSLAGKPHPVLTPDSIHTLLTPIKDNYALGINVLTTGDKHSFFHNGGNAGYCAFYIGYQDGDGAMMMTNGENGHGIILEALRAIAQAYGWPDYKPAERTLITLPLAQQLQYVGKFSAPGVVDFTITAADQTLSITLPANSPMPLLPSSPTLFFVKAGNLQLRFDTPSTGALLFGDQKVPFTRLP